MHQMLPVLFGRLEKIQEPRNPKKLKHRITALMLYGILVFVFQYGSRRAANGEITRAMFEHNLRLLFPQLDSLPHSDTLFRLLCRIDVGAIEQAHIELVNRLIRNKKFSRHLINTLARFSKKLAELFSTLGVQAAIGFIRNTLTGPWLDPQQIEQRLNRAFRLRLV